MPGYTPIGQIGSPLGPAGPRTGWVQGADGVWRFDGIGVVGKDGSFNPGAPPEGYRSPGPLQDFIRGYVASGGDPHYYGRIYDDFVSGPTIFTAVFAGLGGTSTVGPRTAGATPNGPLGYVRAAASASGDSAYITTANGQVNMQGNAGAAMLLRTSLAIPTPSDGTNGFWIEFGLIGDTAQNVGSATEFLGFYGNHSSGGGNWIARTEAGGTPSTVTTTVPLTNGPTYLLEVLYDTVLGKAFYYIDHVQVAMIPSNLPTADLAFHVGLAKTAGSASREVWIDFAEIIYRKRMVN